MTAHCAECGGLVDPYAIGTFRGVTGWVENRRGGGANHVAARVDTGAFLCKGCGETKKMRHRRDRIAGQGAMF